MRWWLVRTIWNPSKLPSTGMPGGLENSSVTFCGIWGLIVSHGYLSCNMSPNYFLDEVSMWLNCCFFLIYYCFYVPRPLRTSRVARKVAKVFIQAWYPDALPLWADNGGGEVEMEATPSFQSEDHVSFVFSSITCVSYNLCTIHSINSCIGIFWPSFWPG